MGATIDHADRIGRVGEIMQIQTPDAIVNKAVLADIFHPSPRDSRVCVKSTVYLSTATVCEVRNRVKVKPCKRRVTM